MKRFESSQTWSADELSGAGIRMETPTRAPGIASDLLVPFGQAIITGMLFSSLVTFLVGRTDFDGELGPLWLGLALAIGTATWLFLLVDTRRLLRVIEELTGLDIDGDGTAGKPKERYIPVNVPQARQEAAQIAAQTERAEVACELAEFVARIPTHGTDSRTWEKRIGREKYTAFRGLLLELGWAAWNSAQDKRQGWSLVLPVRTILQRISAEY